ncbi:tRNA A64-2'-O-ribosylphosphate transferase [Pyrenophora tritici-repentis]|nr:tRNA A64-2'-O-ribosylphosphate transferase [Pyrenophora tritici-repentis]
MSQPLTEADIIFPHLSNTPNLSSTLSSLRRSTLSTHNRLTSIISDSNFVTTVASAYDLPLVANERCGSWYIPPSQKSGSVYFKSTDGHMGEWSFSLRRLNLQLLDVVGKWGGAVVVDSTRRGKSMPDALSKTTPIWCCVMNRAIFGEEKKQETSLFTPPQAVSESEHAQMEKRIDGFVRQFLEICKPNIPDLRSKLQKPLRPIWITQKSSLPESPPSFPDFHPIVLCTASRRVHGAEASESGYIQGAADDHEAWSHGLTSPLFWKHKDALITTSEEDAPALIKKLISSEKASNAIATLINPTTQIYISPSSNIELKTFDTVIGAPPPPFSPDEIKRAGVRNYLHLPCQPGKLGSRDLRTQLPRLIPFISSLSYEVGKILLCCPTGKDLSVGTALALLCLYANDTGVLDTGTPRPAREIGKAFIKQRLSWITTSDPALNPSRSTLQSVNAVLLESRDPKGSIPIPLRPSSIPLSSPSPRQSLPSTIFTTLQSPTTNDPAPWLFTRTLTSALPTHPSGRVTGTATFTLCPLPANFPPTLLYAEEGAFVTDTGVEFGVRKRYVYQLKGTDDEDGGEYISVSFFNDEAMPRSSIEDGVGGKGEGVGGLFVEMGELIPTTANPGVDMVEGMLQAKNKETHLCAQDLYTASWSFGRGWGEADDGGM